MEFWSKIREGLSFPCWERQYAVTSVGVPLRDRLQTFWGVLYGDASSVVKEMVWCEVLCRTASKLRGPRQETLGTVVHCQRETPGSDVSPATLCNRIWAFYSPDLIFRKKTPHFWGSKKEFFKRQDWVCGSFYNSSTWGVEAGSSGVQGHPQLLRQFETTLS